MYSKEVLKLQIFDALKRNGAEQDGLSKEISDIINGYFYESSESTGPADVQRKVDLFLGARRIEGLSPQTLKNYKLLLRNFAGFVDKSVEEITTDDIRAYIAYLSDTRDLKDKTMCTYLHILKSFFSWLMLEEVIKKNPCLKIKPFKIDKWRSRKALNTEELERLRNACKKPRERLIVEFLYSTGCRLSEAIDIKVSDMNFIERSVRVIGKGNKERTVYFSVKAKLYVEDYLKTRKGTSDYLFIGEIAPYNKLKDRAVQRSLRIIGKRAELGRRIHPHLLRHTFASDALRMGMDITIIQRLLGHSQISTTQIYAQHSQDIIRQAYNRLIS